MTTQELLTKYRTGVESLRELRARAGFAEPDLKDGPELHAEAQRFAQKLAVAADAAEVEIDLLADHAGAQSLWHIVATQWEALELLLLPAAFELVPHPLPYEVLAVTVLAFLQTETPSRQGDAAAVKRRGESPSGDFEEQASTANESLGLSPRKAEGGAGAVWEFKDVY